MVARKKAKPFPKLRPIRELSPRQASERRRARKLGFKHEYELRRFVRERQNLPPQHPEHIRKGIRGARRDAEIAATRRIRKRGFTPTRRILDAYARLVQDGTWSRFTFLERYDAFMASIETDGISSEGDRLKMRRLRKELTLKSYLSQDGTDSDGNPVLF